MKKGEKIYNIYCKYDEILSNKVLNQIDTKDRSIYIILINVFNIDNFIKSAYFSCIEVGDAKYNLFIRKVNNNVKIRFVKKHDNEQLLW